MLHWHSPGGIRGKMEYLRFSVLISNLPVAQAGKDSTASPCGIPPWCKRHSGHRWLLSAALWRPFVPLAGQGFQTCYIIRLLLLRLQIFLILLQVLADVLKFPLFQMGIKKLEKISVHHNLQRPCEGRDCLSLWGVSSVCAAVGGINPLTCTIFDPADFGSILRNHVFHISPTKFKKSIMGNYLDFALKIAHRGKRKLVCMLG